MVITFIAQSSITLSVIHQYNMVCLSLVPGTVAPGFSFKKLHKVGNILNASWKNPFLQRIIIRYVFYEIVSGNCQKCTFNLSQTTRLNKVILDRCYFLKVNQRRPMQTSLVKLGPSLLKTACGDNVLNGVMISYMQTLHAYKNADCRPP